MRNAVWARQIDDVQALRLPQEQAYTGAIAPQVELRS
jgi:hypothetical protein